MKYCIGLLIEEENFMKWHVGSLCPNLKIVNSRCLFVYEIVHYPLKRIVRGCQRNWVMARSAEIFQSVFLFFINNTYSQFSVFAVLFLIFSLFLNAISQYQWIFISQFLSFNWPISQCFEPNSQFLISLSSPCSWSSWVWQCVYNTTY